MRIDFSVINSVMKQIIKCTVFYKLKKSINPARNETLL